MFIVKTFFSTILYAVFLVLTVLIFIPMALLTIITRKDKIAVFVCKMWLNVILHGMFWVRTEVSGLENIQCGKNYLIFSNHQSFIDIPLLSGCIPIYFKWLAKKSLFKIPIIGTSMSLAGFIPIERESARKAQQSIAMVQKRLQKGESIMVFPEGTRSYGDRLGPFKRGGISVLSGVNVPILPVTISGSYNVLCKNNYTINFFRKIRIHIDPPRYYEKPLNKEEQLNVLNDIRVMMEKNISRFIS